MSDRYAITQPMRIQARRGSSAEQRYYHRSALPEPWRMPKAIANGVSPRPLEDLIFHGGKIVPQMLFQNIYCGSSSDWNSSDVEKIDAAIAAAMRDRRLNNVMAQYFAGTALSCDPLESLKLEDQKPALFDEPDVQAKIVTLFRSGQIRASDLEATIFNLVLPRGSVLALGDSDSLHGLGGYHGSVHVQHNGRRVTLYYSANVFSEGDNGIPVFDLYSAYCRKGWGGRVRQNLPPGHANFHRWLFLTTLAIKRSESFSKLHENRP